MALHETWHLRSRSRQCSATGTPFIEGQPIITAIFPDLESSGYLRKDYLITGTTRKDMVHNKKKLYEIGGIRVGLVNKWNELK